MTEADWLEGAHPLDMIDHAIGKVSARKLRMFVAACCLAVGRDSAALACQRVADGFADVSTLLEVRDVTLPDMGNRNTWSGSPTRIRPGRQAGHVAFAATRIADPAESAVAVAGFVFPQLQRGLIGLIHEVIGNPFRPVQVPHSWLAANDWAALALARGIYKEGAFERMPVLGDALEDAGCEDEALLTHCREKKLRRHVRGCWTLDALLLARFPVMADALAVAGPD